MLNRFFWVYFRGPWSVLDTLMVSILADISQVYDLDENYIPWSLIVNSIRIYKVEKFAFYIIFWMKLSLMGLIETKCLKVTPNYGKCSPAAFRFFEVDFIIIIWSLNVWLSLPHFTVIKDQLNDTFKWNRISQNVVPFFGKIWFLLSNALNV